MGLLLFSKRRAKWRISLSHSLNVSTIVRTPHGHRLSTSHSPNFRSSLTISIYDTGIILFQGMMQNLEAFDKFFNKTKDTMVTNPPPTTSTTPRLSPKQPNSNTSSSIPTDSPHLPSSQTPLTLPGYLIPTNFVTTPNINADLHLSRSPAPVVEPRLPLDSSSSHSSTHTPILSNEMSSELFPQEATRSFSICILHPNPIPP